MNVEKMMYNLFKDEGTAETPSQERGDVQDLNDSSPKKVYIHFEFLVRKQKKYFIRGFKYYRRKKPMK